MEESLGILLIGLLIGLSLLSHWVLRQTSAPALVGYLVLGFLLSAADARWEFLTEAMYVRLDFLGHIGVVVLLFHVGLKSDLRSLLKQLRQARDIWLSNVLVSGGVGYVAAYYLLGFAMLPSLYIATALTATSVGVSVAIWEEADVLDTGTGQTLVDVAEMDDITAVILMSLLLALTSSLEDGGGDTLLPTLVRTGGAVIGKLVLFCGFCYAFSRFAEGPLARFYERIEPMPDSMLMLVATGFVIAAIAGLLGFSVAIGAFFAGLVFSRDPKAVILTRPYKVLYDLFTPFFFIAIGSHVDPQSLTSAVVPGVVLLAAAGIGKFVGTGVAAVRTSGRRGAVLLGISMIPRAEIAMILMRQGQAFGPSVVPAEAFSGMVFVSAATCIMTPLVLRPMLGRQSVADAGEPGERS